MATIGKVSAIFSASSSGLKTSVADAIRSFRQLGAEVGGLKSAFDTLGGAGSMGFAAIGPAADVAASKLSIFQRLSIGLQDALRAGRITAEEFSSRMALIGESAAKSAAAVSRGITITAQFESAEAKSSKAVAELNGLLSQGVISQEVHARAMADATGQAAKEQLALSAVAKQMDAMSSTFSEGADVARSVATAEERHAAELQRLRGLLAAGAISQETYGRAVDRADDELRSASAASRSLATATTGASTAVDRISGKLNALIAIQGAQLFGQIAGAVSNATRSFIQMAQGEAESIDKTSKLSRQLGMTYGELAGLKLAGDLAGVGMDTIGKAATKADVAFVKAANGSKLAQQALAGVGLSVDELQNKTPAERFQMMADAIAGLPSPAERARAAIGLFGKSGAELLPLFEGGAGSIKQAVDEANKFGMALTNEQGTAVENMNDAFTRAYSSIQGVVQQVTAYLAPAIQSVTDSFTSLIGGIGGANIGQFIGDGIIAGAEFLATIADAVISGLSTVWEYVSTVGSQWSAIFDLGGRVAAFLSGVGNSLKFIFGAAILGITGPIQALLKGADFLAKRVGVDLGVDQFIAGAEGFNQSIVDSMTEAANGAGADFARMVSGAEPGTSAQKGPASTMLADAIAAARANRAATNVSSPTTVGPGLTATDTQQQAGPAGPAADAVQAVDSRSKEGLAEMFRLMRGATGDVQEQQLGVLEQIRDAVSEGDVEEIVSMAGA